MDKFELVKRWLLIDYKYMSQKLGFSHSNILVDRELILDTIRCLDSETSMQVRPDQNTVITILALMWEHVDRTKYDLKQFMLKILSRIGYPTSAIVIDDGYDPRLGQFSSIPSALDKLTVTLQQSQYEVSVGDNTFLLTEFQKQLWDSLDDQSVLGISAPTSAGKSFVILLKTVNRMLNESLDIIYIVPTLSLLNQVSEDYNKVLKQCGVQDYFITNNLALGESKSKHTIYVWTQEKAISTLSADGFKAIKNRTLLIVDEIQNIERMSDEGDIRAKILFDTLQELRCLKNIDQIVIAGPRIDGISNLGNMLFGQKTLGIDTRCSPVLNLTYSIRKVKREFSLKQYCGIVDSVYEQRIENDRGLSNCKGKKITPEFVSSLANVVNNLKDCQNIIFSPTSTAARETAVALTPMLYPRSIPKIKSLIAYYEQSVHKNYSLCSTLDNGIAYHHGKMPLHVRRSLEKAMKEKYISNIVCTTTLMQGVNLPAQNVIVRNPHLYTRRRKGSAELTNYEMANLRGRAGRLLKDFVGRTIVLDENEFEITEGYEQESLFTDTRKDVSVGYGECFEAYKEEILDVVESETLVGHDMKSYGHLVTYIRQNILRYGTSAKDRMDQTGVSLTREQVAAIILKLKELSVPQELCLQNRYWDPFVLNDIYMKYSGTVPGHPTDKRAEKQLADVLKFLRDNESTSHMYESCIPAQYRKGPSRHMLCASCIKWASQKPLSELLTGTYYEGNEGAEHIETTIKLLQETVSFNIPLLIKPVVEMKNKKSPILSCLQTGAYSKPVRRLIEIGVPRELAIELGYDNRFKRIEILSSENNYDYDVRIKNKLEAILPKLPYWKQVQLSFLL